MVHVLTTHTSDSLSSQSGNWESASKQQLVIGQFQKPQEKHLGVTLYHLSKYKQASVGAKQRICAIRTLLAPIPHWGKSFFFSLWLTNASLFPLWRIYTATMIKDLIRYVCNQFDVESPIPNSRYSPSFYLSESYPIYRPIFIVFRYDVTLEWSWLRAFRLRKGI